MQLPFFPLDTRSLLLWLTLFLLGASSYGFSSRRHPGPVRKDDTEKTVVIAYHKPPNVITSHSDADALAAAKSGPRTTVYDDIQSLQGWVGKNAKTSNFTWEQITGIRSKLHAIGRLDCDTTGLLLLTNDGALVHHVTNPASRQTPKAVTKTYQAVIMGYHENDCAGFDRIRNSGVDIGAKHGGMTRPAIDLRVLDHPTEKSTLVSITIAEGKNRQVRRMFHSIGSGVMKLKRTQIGNHLSLDGLELGQWRILADDEVGKALNWRIRSIEDKSGKFRSKDKQPQARFSNSDESKFSASKPRNRRRKP